MTIKATFTGKDSLGYVHGKEYELFVSETPFTVEIKRINKLGFCPYTSLFTFLQNWNNITVIK